MHLAGNSAALLADGNGYCVNGRTGFSFIVPGGATTQFVELFVGWSLPPNPDLKIRLEPDCIDGYGTACMLTPVWDPRTGKYVAKASGRFTWPGDEDWYRLDDTQGPLLNVRTATQRDTCVASARVERAPDTFYLVLTGGPAGCSYTVTARGF